MTEIFLYEVVSYSSIEINTFEIETPGFWLTPCCAGLGLALATTLHYPLPTTHYPLPRQQYTVIIMP